MQLKIPVLEHYDDDDIGRVGERVVRDGLTGFPEIRHPKWTGQTTIADIEGAVQPEGGE